MTTTNRTATITLPSDREILITRTFDAPPDLLFRAWTEPDLVSRWWSGRHGELTTCEIDLRVGGSWRYVMVGQGGFEVAFHGEYREIIPGARLVTTEVFEGAEPLRPADEPLNVIAFEEAGGGTILRLLVQTTSTELRDAILNSGMEQGMHEQFELLEAVASDLR
jgi:uncharacterized protein YndB with AHSA1/START domain